MESQTGMEEVRAGRLTDQRSKAAESGAVLPMSTPDLLIATWKPQQVSHPGGWPASIFWLMLLVWQKARRSSTGDKWWPPFLCSPYHEDPAQGVLRLLSSCWSLALWQHAHGDLGHVTLHQSPHGTDPTSITEPKNTNLRMIASTVTRATSSDPRKTGLYRLMCVPPQSSSTHCGWEEDLKWVLCSSQVIQGFLPSGVQWSRMPKDAQIQQVFKFLGQWQ